MPKAITPSRLNQRMKEIIDSVTKSKRFDIVGEISNMKSHSNGNLYFTIKDANAQINCIMFANNSSILNFRPIDGMQVEMNVSVFFNVKTGSYSLNVYAISEVGIGDLSRQYNLLKDKLEREGVFSSIHKKEIPKFPKTIAVITSPTGAAVLDIISTIKRRYPIAKIIVLSTLVQGENAKYSIVENIRYVNNMNLADTIICGRGGGSIEDLWAFNEEMVVRAIFDSKIPIISSVGHETDTTIADFVADVRAATPTAAAEIATCDINKLNNDIINFENYTKKVLVDKLDHNKKRLQILSENQYFLNPILAKKIQFDTLDTEFHKNVISFDGKIKLLNHNLNTNYDKINDSVVNNLNTKQNNVKVLHAKLDILNPLATLSRGYSITSINDKAIVDITEVKTGDIIKTKLSKGKVTSIVTEVENDG